MSLFRKLLPLGVSKRFATGLEPVPEEAEPSELPSTLSRQSTEPVRNRSRGHPQVPGHAPLGSEKYRRVKGEDLARYFLKSLQHRAPCTLTFPELFEAYTDLLADREIPALPWDSFARHFNKLIQQKGKPRQTRMRLLNPKTGRRDNTRVYYVPVWKPVEPAVPGEHDSG